MVLQSYGLYEVEVGMQNLVWRVPAQHPYEQRNDALYYKGVALCREYELAVGAVALQPYAALASVYEVLLGFVFLVEGTKLVAQVYKHLVFVHPVVEVSKLADYFVLYLVYCHSRYQLFSTFSIRNSLSLGRTFSGTGIDTRCLCSARSTGFRS